MTGSGLTRIKDHSGIRRFLAEGARPQQATWMSTHSVVIYSMLLAVMIGEAFLLSRLRKNGLSATEKDLVQLGLSVGAWMLLVGLTGLLHFTAPLEAYGGIRGTASDADLAKSLQVNHRHLVELTQTFQVQARMAWLQVLFFVPGPLWRLVNRKATAPEGSDLPSG